MTTADHPSLDTIADYCAALLPAPEADALAEHLSQCSRCTNDAAAVQQVPAILSGAASTLLPMPESVKRTVDDVLRAESEARVGSVVRLADRRTSVAPRDRSRVPLLAAAAAVIAVAGIAGLVRNIDLSTQADSTSSSTAYRDGSPPGSRAASQPSAASGGAAKTSPQPLSPQNLSSYAAGLSRGQPSQQHSKTDTALAAGCATPHTQPTDLVTVARWQGARAVVVVDPGTRRVTVLDCDTAVTVLYSTSY